jgi:uncharacterized protein (TIGR03083 family)
MKTDRHDTRSGEDRRTPAGIDIQSVIAAERTELAAMLAALPAQQWDRQTLCAGWRVREVVAHMTMPFRYSALWFIANMVRARGDFAAMADRCARRDADRLGPGELTAALRDNAAYPWKPPGGGFEGALTHDVIHGLDITTALGIGRRVPADRLRIVLAGLVTPKVRKLFGADLDGIELRADDISWTFGSGTPMRGAAQDLALVVCGRKLPPGRLSGAPAARFTAA